MTKELFVSSTPHETKVGMVEDDLLAEIYLERENEYTLAGSIYKGRVTRVLPGMQSAFVDVGLERDAFLYVSDFMEVEDGEEVDEIPTNRPVTTEARYQAPAPTRAEVQPLVIEGPDFSEEDPAPAEHLEAAPAATENRQPPNGEERDDRGGYRGRRRRRGGRRGERMPESKFARPAADAPRESPRETPPRESFRSERTERPERPEYGPPPGYQPIILPGES